MSSKYGKTNGWITRKGKGLDDGFVYILKCVYEAIRDETKWVENR
jgi:hypothetical protein